MIRQFILSSLLMVSATAYAESIQPLPLNQAFKPTATLLDPNTIQVTWDITPGYYLYKERFHFMLDDGPKELGEIKFPVSETKINKKLGTYNIYRNKVDFIIPILVNRAGDDILRINYQGCADNGFCYPPSVSAWVITSNEQLEAVNINPLINETVISDGDTLTIHQLLKNQSWLLIALTCLGLGLLLSFTPCVLPMYPILSGIIVGYGSTITKAKAFRLSLTYVLSMALTYTFIGIAFALVGKNIQVSLQQPWIIILLALLFIILALSMFRFYDLKMPSFLENRLTALSQHQRGGSYLGVAIMGALATLILSPCVTAPLVGVLSFITQSGNIFLGGSALFFLGLGMGIPLLFIGASCGTLLPKTGPWMEGIKIIFGILLLGVAVYLINRIIPGNFTLITWGTLGILSAIYLGAFQSGRGTLQKMRQALGIMLLVYSVLLILGGGLGNNDLLRPLQNLALTHKTSAADQLDVIAVKSIDEVAAAIKKNKGKPIMLDFYASWCISCNLIEREVLNEPDVRQTLKHFVYLKADITANDATDAALMKHYQVVAPPTFIFFDKKGNELKPYRLVGEFNESTFSQHLQKVLMS